MRCFFSKRVFLLAAFLPFLMGGQCDQGALFDTITTEFASPIAVAVDTTRLRAYVVNSNNELTFTTTTLSILDITDPAAPILLNHAANPIAIPNFSSLIYLDTTSATAYIPNRLSENASDTTDSLLKINLDEASGSFATIETVEATENPFGITCCDGQGRLYVTASGGPDDGMLHAFDPNDLSSSSSVSLAIRLDSGENFSGRNSVETLLLGNQAFVTNRSGRIYVINTTEVGTAANAVDRIILSDEGDFRGITTDGTSLFVVDGSFDEEVLRILNPSTLTAINPDVSDVTEHEITDIQTAAISVGEDPQEVVVFNGRAYVSNMGSNSISVIDIAGQSVIQTISVGEEPFGLTAFTLNSTDYLYVTNLGDNSLSVIDLSSNTVVTTFSP